MARDYKVPFCTEETLARFADRLRKQARRTGRYTIDIVGLIERFLTDYFAQRGGLKIEFFDADKFDDPAYVKYQPLTLHVDRRIWEDARRGLDYAIFILAHEIAHLLFHDHMAVAFSYDENSTIKWCMDEERAEWQADRFAKHLTMPDRVLLKTIDPYLIAILCNVDEKVAIERVASYKKTGPMLHITYDGEPCGECGNFTLVRNGTCLECDTCGGTTGCS
jgi:Zn-dependent peptidase ImmA (M78 family)